MTDSSEPEAPTATEVASAPPPETEETMEIHKPKPWHGWREFLKEYGIIVLGVLTALALEQVVDALRWAHEIGEARQALGHEIAYNIKALKLIDDENGCMTARLGELERWADGAGPKPEAAGRHPVLWTLSTSAWDVANSGQVVAHFPLDQKLGFARAYASFDNEREAVAEERTAWANIVAIAADAKLDDSDRRELRHAIGLARTVSGRRRGNAALAERQASPLAIDGPGPEIVKGGAADPARICGPEGSASGP